MKSHQKGTRGGFLHLVLLAVVAIALLAYFKVDLRAFLDKPIFQKLLNIFVVGWGTYLKPFVVYLWTSVAGLFGK